MLPQSHLTAENGNSDIKRHKKEEVIKLHTDVKFGVAVLISISYCEH